MVNNILENTQVVFTTIAVLGCVRSFAHPGSLLWAAAGGASVVAAVLTKGPVGFFPLIVPVIAAALFTGETRRRALGTAVVMSVVVVGASVLLYAVDESRDALSLYVQQQLAPTLAGERGGHRWADVARHLNGGILLRMGILAVLVYVAGRRLPRTAHVPPRAAAHAWLFSLTALAASFPVAFSPRVVGHYLIPSVPCYALAFAALTLTVAGPGIERVRLKGAVAAGLLGLLLMLGAVALPLAGWTYDRRDPEFTEDLARMAPMIARGAIAGTCPEARDDWRLHAYMQRWFRVSLSAEPAYHGQFIEIRDVSCLQPVGCAPIVVGNRLALHSCEARPGR
jgi:hypothetical protein